MIVRILCLAIACVSLTAAAAQEMGTPAIYNYRKVDERHATGMKYHHISVPWDRPGEADFIAFDQAMQSTGEGKTLVHCAANFRATAFYSLYAMKPRLVAHAG